MKKEFITELVPITELRPHPKNYQTHPEDQIIHIITSIKKHGIYKPIITARDGTVLAGHGVLIASQRIGLLKVPIVRLNIYPDSPAALKIVVGDNEINHLCEKDDRLLADLLKEIKESEEGLLGTGFDEMMLANLVFVTRPENEILDFDEAAEWVGMPDYEEQGPDIRLTIFFRTEEDREAFVNKSDVGMMKRGEKSWSAWWPPKERDDVSSVCFKEG